MQLITELVILLVLGAIFVQDLKSRAVYWFWFPLLFIAFIVLQLLKNRPVQVIWQPALINVGFLFIQLALVTVYFSIKNGRPVNITKHLLGWGDILLLLTVSFYLSVLNFILFYISSLITVLVFWGLLQAVSSNKNKHIPLAGFQSILFIVFLAGDWWCFHLNIMDDTWLLRLIT